MLTFDRQSSTLSTEKCFEDGRGLHHLETPPFSREKRFSHCRAVSPHLLPVSARAPLLTPSLPIALCAKNKKEKPVEEAVAIVLNNGISAEIYK